MYFHAVSVLFYFMAAGAAPYTEAEQAILQDVQDGVGSIEQAGWYVLLERIGKTHLSNYDKDIYVDPDLLLRQPSAYRGQRVKYTFLLDPAVYRIKPARTNYYSDYLYYVVGQIPFGEKRRMPAIVVFRDEPERVKNSDKSIYNSDLNEGGAGGGSGWDEVWGRLGEGIIDGVELSGYFYMVLRSQTRAVNEREGPGVLDYLVLVTEGLPEGVGKRPAGAYRGKEKNGWAAVLGVLVLGLVWLGLRYRIRKAGPVKKVRWQERKESGLVKTDTKFEGRVVPVELGESSYPIYIGWEVLGDFGRTFVEHCGGKQALVITDENVAGWYGQAVVESLARAGVRAQAAAVPAGEKSKSLPQLERLYEKMFDLALERSDAVVALGGGVVGDLAGYAAATFKRGVRLVQVPTTLLAMVDSSIGGKTGINHARGKNMIGSFYQPRMVYADASVLGTLPRRELGCGLAETVKHAVIRDGEFFELLEKEWQQVLALDRQRLIELVERNCRIKAAVVSADEKESGLRGILNFGHTIGHTLETVLAARDYHHGEAVSLGMAAASRLAVRRGLMGEEAVRRILHLLEVFGLPTGAEDLPVAELYRAMLQDKKVTGGRIRFVLPTGIGRCTFVEDLTEAEIQWAIMSLMPGN